MSRACRCAGRRHDLGAAPSVGAVAAVMPATAVVGTSVPASAGAATMGELAPGALEAAPSVGGVAMMAPPTVLLIAGPMMGCAAMRLAASMTGLGPLAASPAILPARVPPLPLRYLSSLRANSRDPALNMICLRPVAQGFKTRPDCVV